MYGSVPGQKKKKKKKKKLYMLKGPELKKSFMLLRNEKSGKCIEKNV